MRQLSLIGVAAVCAGVLSAHSSLHLTFFIDWDRYRPEGWMQTFCTDWVMGSMRDYVMQVDLATFLSAERGAICASADVL